MRRRGPHLILAVAVVLAALALPAAAADLQEGVNGFLSALPADFDTVAAKTLVAKQNAGEEVFVLDVREPDEYKAGHIEGAVNIPIRVLAQELPRLPADKGTSIAVVCKSGVRAAYATMALKLFGYTNVKDIVGGMLGWEKDGLPVAK